MLDPADLQKFREDGYVGPFAHPLISEGSDLARRIRAGIGRVWDKLAYPGHPVEEVLPRRLDSGMIWFKSCHLVIPEIWEMVRHPAILERVTDLLGPDVAWWGTSIVDKKPGDIHGWHYDAEYASHEGILLWLGLEGLEPRSNLKLITRTHVHHKPPVAYTEGGRFGTIRGTGVLSDANAVLQIAQGLDPRSELVDPPMHTGEFLITEGHLWHGSKHEGSGPRTALVLHFSKPDADVKIPTSFDAEPQWYHRPPTAVLLAGSAGPNARIPFVTEPLRV